MQLALLAFGIVAGIEAVGVPFAEMLGGSGDVLGAWAPWIGVLVFAVGVVVANSAPGRSFPSLLIVLYAAWAGQVLGNVLLGGCAERLRRRAGHDARRLLGVPAAARAMPPTRPSCPASGCWSRGRSGSSG